MREILREMVKFEKEDTLAYAWSWLVGSAFLLLVIAFTEFIEHAYAIALCLFVFAVAQLSFAGKYKKDVSSIKHVEFENNDKEVKR